MERYKTRKFLESKPHRLRMSAATNNAASKIRKMRESGATAQKISNTPVEKLNNISEEVHQSPTSWFTMWISMERLATWESTW